MNNILLFILILLFVFYIYFSLRKPKEGFDDLSILTDTALLDHHNFNTRLNGDSYDKFYSFLYNDIYFDEYTIENIIKKVAEIILSYANSVYSHHLDASSKCGHLTELLYNSMDTKCMQNHENLIHYEHYKYPNHNITKGDLYDIDAIRPNTFTHVSILNYDIYDYEDIGTVMKNIDTWLVDKGYLFILVFSNFDEIMNFYNQNGNILNGKFIYSSELQKQMSNKYSLIEKLRTEKYTRERKNIHTKYFHSNDHIIYYGNMYGLELVDNKEIINGTNLLILRKSN